MKQNVQVTTQALSYLKGDTASIALPADRQQTVRSLKIVTCLLTLKSQIWYRKEVWRCGCIQKLTIT